MSLGYAERLSHREDLGGRLGDPELFEAPHIALDKSKELAELIRDAAKLVVFTGAGISTAAGIPDFRGPQGVWTLQRKGLPLPKLHTSFVYAKPSLTHQALLGLMQSGNLQYICSQNVDSLHLRSGVPRTQLAELHGNCFAERCKKCKAEYVRDFEMDTVGFKLTGRRCTQPGCRGMLVDHILDWEDALPPAELKATEQHASSANLSLCLGTSLQIIPAANLPLRTVRSGGKLAIVNLQATPKDKKAHCVVHARVDEVMSVIMQHLGIPIPVYARTDRVQLSHAAKLASSSHQQQAEEDSSEEEEQQQQHEEQQQQQQQQSLQVMDGVCGLVAAADDDGESLQDAAAAAAGTSNASNAAADTATADGNGDNSSSSGGSSWSFTLSINSIHGLSCPLPMVASASVSFLGDAAAAGLKPRQLLGQLPWRLTRSCPAGLQQVQLQVQFALVDAADEGRRSATVQYLIDKPQQQEQQAAGRRPRSTRGAAGEQQQPDGSQVFEFVTQQLDYAEKQQQLIAQLQAAAEESRSAAPAAAEAEAAAAAAAAGKPRKRASSKGSSKRSGCAQQREGSVSGGSRSRSKSKSVVSGDAPDSDAAEAAADDTDAAGSAGEQQQGTSAAAEASAGDGATQQQAAAGSSKEPDREVEEQAVDEISSDADDEGGSVEESGSGLDYLCSNSDDAEVAAGQRGQNSTGRPRKRTKRLNM